MKALIGLLIATMLGIGSGCAKQDWIDRTLVTVDVSGNWTGRWEGGAAGLLFELEQQGSMVKGSMRFTGGGATTLGTTPGPLEGTVAGDVFRFRTVRGDTEGELTVSGDEMIGRSSVGGTSSSPGAPPR